MAVEKSYRFQSALVGDKWIDQPVITVSDGLITSIESSDASTYKHCESIDGVALPGISNLHSHAFQRGFAGLSEYRTAENDSFWTWRKLIYDFVWKLDPSDIYVIAKQVYLEMLRAGYCWVGEFHYVHNDKNGLPYGNLTELADAVTRAATDVGIGICLLPTLYTRGGFERELEDGQKRFALSPDLFLDLVNSCQSEYAGQPNFEIGMAIHSLRAVDHLTAERVVQEYRRAYSDRPIHIHIAEQTGEVDECLSVTGKRPIQYLFDNFDIDGRWCLIHATHADKSELESIANSKAVVGLCPTTEANLGDGIFPADEFMQLDGRFGVGSDSHVAINVAAELRMIEYGQRLQQRKRAVLGSDRQSVGRRLYQKSAAGGAQALGINGGGLAVGKRADLMVVDSDHPTIAGAEQDRLLDRLVFCEHGNPIHSSMVGGKWIDAPGQLEQHRPGFLKVMSKLSNNRLGI